MLNERVTHHHSMGNEMMRETSPITPFHIFFWLHERTFLIKIWSWALLVYVNWGMLPKSSLASMCHGKALFMVVS